MSNKMRKVALLLVVVILTLSLAACAKEEIVAKVDKVEISREEFYDRLISISGNEVLETLIAETLVDLEVEKLEIEVAQEEIDEEMTELENYYGGEEQLKNQMSNNGLTIKDLEEQIVRNLQIKQLVTPYIDITDEQVEGYYEANVEQLGKPEQVRARHILVETKEEADDIHGQLMDGGDFEELAKEHSTDGSAAQGGDLGLFGRGQMVGPFEEAAFSMEAEQISEPVESEFGFHIIKVEEKVEAVEANFEDMEDDIRSTLFDQQISTAYGTWFAEKSEEYDIVNYLHLHEGQ